MRRAYLVSCAQKAFAKLQTVSSLTLVRDPQGESKQLQFSRSGLHFKPNSHHLEILRPSDRTELPGMKCLREANAMLNESAASAAAGGNAEDAEVFPSFFELMFVVLLALLHQLYYFDCSGWRRVTAQRVKTKGSDKLTVAGAQGKQQPVHTFQLPLSVAKHMARLFLDHRDHTTFSWELCAGTFPPQCCVVFMVLRVQTPARTRWLPLCRATA